MILQGQINFRPPLNNATLNAINNNFNSNHWELNSNHIECISPCVWLNTDVIIGQLKTLINQLKGRKLRFSGQFFAIKGDPNKFTKWKYYIKNGKVQNENIDFNFVKVYVRRKAVWTGPNPGPENKEPSSEGSRSPSPPPPPQSPPPKPKSKSSSQTTTTSSGTPTPQPSRSASPPRSPKKKVRSASPPPPKIKPPPKPSPPPNIPTKLQRNITLNYKSFSTLFGQRKLDDGVVNAYIQYSDSRRQDNRKIGIAYTSWIQYLVADELDIVSRFALFKQIPLRTMDYLLFPMCYERQSTSHWILGIVDFHAKEIQIYDSIQDAFQYTSFTNAIAKFLRHNGINITKVNYIKGPKQTDYFSCGVFVSEFAKRFLLQEDTQGFSQATIMNVRARIRTELKQFVKKK